MERPISLLMLPDWVGWKLQSAGFNTVEDVENYLVQHGDIPPFLRGLFEEHGILERIKSLKRFSTVRSGLDLLNDHVPPVVVFHRGLAAVLDGGLHVGQITELCGPPGSGKTQICQQFCVDVRIPREYGGSAGDALYITTDFGFQVDRLRQMCMGTINHLFAACGDGVGAKEKLTVSSFLSGITVVRVFELPDFYRVLDNLKLFFETNRSVKLVVIDSFSLPMIVNIEDVQTRTKTISFFLSGLLDLAVQYKFALVLTNQITTVVSGENNTVVKPALGQAYGHRVHRRLILRDERIYVTKSISLPQIFAGFKITTEGIR